MLRAAANLNVWKYCKAAYMEVKYFDFKILKRNIHRYKLDFPGAYWSIGAIFAHIIILFVPLDGSWHVRQLIKTIWLFPLHFLPFLLLFVCFFYVLRQQDGHRCRLHFRMQCVCHALFITCFDIALCGLCVKISCWTESQRMLRGKGRKMYFVTFLPCCLCFIAGCSQDILFCS